MKRSLAITIDCGERTCASKPGMFCQYVGSTRFGMAHGCRLFPGKERSYTALEEVDGWLQRCPACLLAGKPRSQP